MANWTTMSFWNRTRRNELKAICGGVFKQLLNFITFKSFVLRIVFVWSHCSCCFWFKSLIHRLICCRSLFKTVRNIFEGTVSLWHKSEVYYVSRRMYHLKLFKYINMRLNIWGKPYVLDNFWTCTICLASSYLFLQDICEGCSSKIMRSACNNMWTNCCHYSNPLIRIAFTKQWLVFVDRECRFSCIYLSEIW